MENEKERVVPTDRELKCFDLNDTAIVELIHHAQESDEADRLLTVRQALKKYKKAVFWAMLLSTSLVMEGYDLVIVRSLPKSQLNLQTDQNTDQFVLRANTVPSTIWNLRSCFPEETHSR